MDKTIYLTKKGKLIQSKLETKEFEELIAIEAMKTEKIEQATKYFLKHPTFSRREFREALSSTLLNNRKTEESMRAAIYALYAWAKFIYEHLDESKLDSVSK